MGEFRRGKGKEKAKNEFTQKSTLGFVDKLIWDFSVK